MRIAFIAALAASLVAAAPSSADTVLTGTVGPGFSISLEDASGAAVSHLDAGTYTLLVHDLSDEHNFHLSGPGVNVSTDVTFVGDETFTITVGNGTYTFACDPHATRMHGLFTGGTTQPPTTTTPVPAAKPLALAVGPGRRLTAPARLAAGRYAISARDASTTDNLHLKGPGVDRRTGVAFTGQARWTVTLKAGTYRVASDAHRLLARTIVVR